MKLEPPKDPFIVEGECLGSTIVQWLLYVDEYNITDWMVLNSDDLRKWRDVRYLGEEDSERLVFLAKEEPIRFQDDITVFRIAFDNKDDAIRSRLILV